NYNTFIKKQKKNIQSDNDSVSLKELFDVQHRQEKIVENITNVFQDTLPKKPIRQKKSSFFNDNNFLDGFEDDLKELGMTIGEAYEKLDDTATLFNKY
ncbi:MAG: hypothetical protein NTY91_01440, partial [Euryarchaeota archaeon]|nr:hypothetical protein [Euryarchaeota archaeon]